MLSQEEARTVASEEVGRDRVQVVTGPPMIKDENGVLVGYVFADIDAARRDLGGWVSDAKEVVSRELALPKGYRLQWTGQYEFMEEMQDIMAWVIPFPRRRVASVTVPLWARVARLI